jgi:hypothetical protein
MLVWIDESRLDRARHRIDYTIEPNLPPRWRDRFDSRGAFTSRQAVLVRPEPKPEARIDPPTLTAIG